MLTHITHQPATRVFQLLRCCLVLSLLLLSSAMPYGAENLAAAQQPRIQRTSPRKAAGKSAARKRQQLLKGFQRVPDSLSLAKGQSAFDGEVLESPKERSDWFLFQRSYPFGALPVAARQQAFRFILKRQLRELSLLGAGQLVQGWRSVGPSPTVSAFFDNWGHTSGRINSVAVSPVDSNLLLVASATGGIWRSTDGGAKFTPVTDTQADLAVASIAFSKKNPTIAYAAMGDPVGGYIGSGILKSFDSGETWVRLNSDSLPKSGQATEIETDPRNADHVYLAQYAEMHSGKRYGGGFYLSTDGGDTWKRTLGGLPRDLLLDPEEPGTLYLAMTVVYGEEDKLLPAGLYKSSDGGKQWSIIYTAPAETGTTDIRVAATKGRTLYVYTGGKDSQDRPEARLVASADGGGKWETRFITHYSEIEKKMKVSADAGETWMAAGDSTLDIKQFTYNNYIEAHPTKAGTIYVGSRDLYKSIDGGKTWTNETRSFAYSPGEGKFNYQPGISNSHPDQHALAFDPKNPEVIYVGNDGGLWKSADGGVTLKSLNGSLSIAQFNSIAAHPTDPAIMYGGTQDNGTQKRIAERDTATATGLKPTSVWKEFSGGDGGKCVINPRDPSMVFITYIYGEISRYRDNGERYDGDIGDDYRYDKYVFKDSSTGKLDRVAFYPPFTGDGINSTLYFGTHRLWVSTDLGESWSAPGGTADLTKGPHTRSFGDVLSAIAVAPSDPKVIYTGSAHGRVMFSIDGGKTWDDIKQGIPEEPEELGIPNRFITSIKVDPINPKIAYLTLSGFLAGHVFKTSDGGATWANISKNLPDVPANALLIDRHNSNILYVGTDVGVFRTSAGSSVWTAISNGMPPVIVNDLVADESGKIYAATYGRGIYELGMISPDTSLRGPAINNSKSRRRASRLGQRMVPVR